MRISLDTETTGLDLRHGARPFLVTIAYEEGGEIYNQWWEWLVDPYTRKVRAKRKDLIAIFKWIARASQIIMHNAVFDIGMLIYLAKDLGIEFEFPWNKLVDTLVAGHLLASNQRHDLTSMVLIYLGINVLPFEEDIKRITIQCRKRAQGKNPEFNWRIAAPGLPEMPSIKPTNSSQKKRGAEDSGPWKSDIWLPYYVARLEGLPEDHEYRSACYRYANSDSDTTLRLWKEVSKRLKKAGLWKIFLTRMKYLKGIYAMEDQGVTISKERLNHLYQVFGKESEKSEKKCLEIASEYGAELFLPKSGNNKSLLSMVFDKDKLGIPPYERSKKTKAPSLNAACIEHYLSTLDGNRRDFLEALQAKRKRDTARTYMEGYRRFWRQVEGDWFRLYPRLNPTGTGTLRTSSSNPNEQNISKQPGFNLRHAFGPAPGREWWSLDYENQELRIPAYESQEDAMIEIFERPNDPPYFGSYHLLNASILYPDLFWPIAEKQGEFKEKYGSTNYRWAKFFGFAVGYGAIPQSGTADKAARVKGAQLRVMDKLKKHTALNQYWIDYANENGYVETIPDKTVDPDRGYPIYCQRKWGRIPPTIPLNYHVQSTACWCTMKASIRCLDYLEALGTSDRYYIIMNVHDELVFDFPAGQGKRPWKTNLPIVRKLKGLMEKSGDDIGIPLPVSVEYHPETWADGYKQQ